MVQKILLLLVITFLTACAGVVTPTGGPKDETPPINTKQVPKNGTLKFKESKIDFYFDEYVVLKDITNQFIISPPLNQNPEIIVKGKKVEVLFKEELKENTTYTLNFGNGIADNNEGNVLSGLSYTFSTGDYIDSLSLKGTIHDGFTLLPVVDAAIGLYKTIDDSTIFKEKPWYLVKPDSSGNFKFNYLSPGVYQLVAFEDVNRNLKIESNEKIAYITDTIVLTYPNNDSIHYPLLLAPQYIPKEPKLITYKEIAKGKYQIITAASNCNIEINSGIFGKKETEIIQKTKNCDTITLYTNNQCIDSTKLSISIDTVNESIVIPCKSKEYNKFSLNSNKTENNYNFIQPLKLSFSNPPVDIRSTEFVLKQDSIQLTDFKIVTDTINPLNLVLYYNWKPETKYTLSIPKGSIKDLYGQDIDSSAIVINTAATSFFGSLTITLLDSTNKHYIVQLLDVQGQIVKENFINKTQNISYQNIAPAQYFIKVIEDSNKNDEWDGTNYFTKQQPEKVFITKKSYEVRASWDITDILIDPQF